jgi:hypothetical protein
MSFDDLFDQALEQLKQWGGVITGLDQECVFALKMLDILINLR